MVSCVGPDGGCWILGRCGVVGVSWRCGGDFLRRAARRKISVAQHCETPPGLGTKKEKKKKKMSKAVVDQQFWSSYQMTEE